MSPLCPGPRSPFHGSDDYQGLISQGSIEKAQARLAELRHQGISPGHGGEAAVKRGKKIAEANRRRSLGLSPEEYRARRAAKARERRTQAAAKTTSDLNRR